MPIFEVERDGKRYEVEAPDAQLAAAAVDPTKRTAFVDKRNEEARVSAQPGNQPGLLERGGRYLAEWGQGMRDAATQPVGGPTGIPLVDAAAGAADFAASAASDTVTAVPRLARMAFTAARGGKVDPTWLQREPTTPTGKAIQDTVGAAFKPAGDALNATGLPPEEAAFGMELLGTAADAVGLGAGARAVKHGVGAVRPEVPNPGTNPRPFGQSVERARRLGFRILPSQVAGHAQAEAPIGKFGLHREVPGTFRQGLTATDLVPMAAIDNQKRVNVFAAKELGISEITPQALALAKNPHNAVFNEVAQALPQLRPDAELGDAAMAIGEARRTNPLLRNVQAVDDVRDRLLTMERIPTQKALDAIRSYRQDAAKLYRQADLGVTGSIDAEQAAQAYRAAADALESAIERQAGRLNPDLISRLEAARTALAKIHNVEDALDGTNVDPQRLVKLSERYPLTGYLAEIADIAREFPETMKSGTGIGLPAQSEIGSIWTPHLFARRHLGREQGPTLLRDEFQNRFGREDPDFDPRPAPPAPAASPIVDYTPPDPNLPGGADVGPPTQGGGGGLAAVGLGEDFDVLPEAAARPGDLTASTPPMGGSLPADTVPPVPEGLSADFGLEAPPRRFTAGEEGILDEGLPFELDPEMASASIVRGGGEPGPVADTELLAQALLDAELRGRPLDPETGAGIAPEGVDRPFTRPAPELGEGFAAGLEELFGGGPPRLGAPDAPDAPLGPSIIEGEFEDITGQNALPPPQRALPAPQKRLPPPPNEDLGASFGEPEPPRGPQLPPQSPDTPRALGSELMVEDNVPRTEVADIADDGLKLENLPEQRPGDVGIKRTKRPPADIIPRKPLPPNPVVYYSGPARNPTRWLVMEEQGDTWILRSIDSTAFKKVNKDHTRPPGREMLTLAAKDAQQFGKRFDSDTDMTVEIIDAIERAVQDGSLIVDDWDASIAAARAALEKSGGKRISRGEKGGEPWFKNIRPAG